jgi:hypothetical protein
MNFLNCSNAWTEVGTMPNARHGHTCTLIKNGLYGIDEIVVVGGKTADYVIKVDIFSMETLSWRTSGTQFAVSSITYLEAGTFVFITKFNRS